ncbi:hypothetical protein F441_03931 [Phytophthora nicotianae CJ01A1]|uniref:Ankyrin repeat-containing domain n=5 Tax=Phytophthora nicotianae TaxID=4792 RepID=W2XKA1_PHYNI|nr:hypothetical protein F441_03931 [Phytophthora nicotianae CJ01A1]
MSLCMPHQVAFQIFIPVTTSMKHSRQDSTFDYSLRQRKRLKYAPLPRSIWALPHVMKRIDLLAMSLEEAAIEAAAINDIDWLRSILDQIEIDTYRDDVGCDGTDVAAAHGNVEIIKTIYRWWVKDSYAPTQLCKRALLNAVNGGHAEAVRVLLSKWYWEEISSLGLDDDIEHPYKFDLMEALEVAVTNEKYGIAHVICELSTIPGEMLLWAAEHDCLEVLEDVSYFHNDMDNLYRAMLVAVSRGCLDIVRFVINKCGPELLDYVDGDDSFPCPLVTAIKHGQREVMEYLYAHNAGCEDDTHAAAFCAAAAYGPLEMVEMIYNNDNENFDESKLSKAFASAAGNSQLETMTHLQTLQNFDQAAFDMAFVEASRNGKMNAVKYVCDIEGYETSAVSLNEAFEGAASGGHIGMLTFLSTKGEISRKVMTNAFKNAIKDIGVLSEARNDQVQVLKFLHSKGRVCPEVVDELFPEAASCCSLAVVEFIHSTGFISTESVNEAFHNAARDNCVELVRFLYNTGVVTEKSIEEIFLNAAGRGDLYVMECLFNLGCNCEMLLEKTLEKDFTRTLCHRVVRFLKQKQHAHEKPTR